MANKIKRIVCDRWKLYEIPGFTVVSRRLLEQNSSCFLTRCLGRFQPTATRSVAVDAVWLMLPKLFTLSALCEKRLLIWCEMGNPGFTSPPASLHRTTTRTSTSFGPTTRFHQIHGVTAAWTHFPQYHPNKGRRIWEEGYLFIHFNWRMITLQFCDGFAIHQPQSATGIHVSHLHLAPPSHLPLPHPVLPGCYRALAFVPHVRHQACTAHLFHIW